MTKLEESLIENPEMSPIAVTRIEVAKLSEPVMRSALSAVVDLVESVVPAAAGLKGPQTKDGQGIIAERLAKAKAAADAAEAAKAKVVAAATTTTAAKPS